MSNPPAAPPSAPPASSPPVTRIDRVGYADRRKHAGQIIALCGIVMSVAAASLLDLQTRREELVIAADSLYEEQDQGRPPAASSAPVAAIDAALAAQTADQATEWDNYLASRRRDRLARDQFVERHNNRVYLTGICIVVTVVLAGAAAALAMVVIMPRGMPRWVTHPAEPVPASVSAIDVRHAVSGISVARAASNIAQALAALSLMGLLGAADVSVMAGGDIVAATAVILAAAVAFARIQGWLTARQVRGPLVIDGIAAEVAGASAR